MDRNRMPPGRTEVSVEDGKYTFVIDFRPEGSGLEILRFDEPWVHDREVVGGNALIALICDLERCRDLLYEISHDFDPEKQLGPDCGPEMLDQIKKTLPQNYHPANYVQETK